MFTSTLSAVRNADLNHVIKLHFHWVQNTHSSNLNSQQCRISRINSTQLAQNPSSEKKKSENPTLTVLSRLFHIDDVLTSRCGIYSVKWIRGKRGRGEKWEWGVKERKIICQGFTLREALSWMPNVAKLKLKPISSGTSKGLATSALWKVTTTKCRCWDLNKTWCLM